MKEGLLLDGIASEGLNVAPRNPKTAALIEADLAHASLALEDGATVAAGDASDAPLIERFPELAFSGRRLAVGHAASWKL
jgi:hypothetical protein